MYVLICGLVVNGMSYLLKCLSQQLMHWDTFKEDNYSTVGGDGGDVGSVRYKPTLLPHAQQ